MCATAGDCEVPGACNPACGGETPFCDPGSIACTCVAGSCPTGKSCSLESGKCVDDVCSLTCSGETPVCDAASQSCVCDDASCPIGKLCVGGACKVGSACDITCSDPTPVCDSLSRSCVCNDTSCGVGKTCIEGACQDADTCVPACKGLQPICDPWSHSCVCSDTSCGAGNTCIDGACQAAKTCDPPCSSGQTPVCDPDKKVCVCTNTSCATGKTCHPILRQCVDKGSCQFYVSTSGKDTNPGLVNQPWRTIQKAADTLQPGQTVYKEGIKVSRGGSSASNMITIKGIGTPVPVVEPTSAIGFDVSAHFIQLERLEIRAGVPNNIKVTGNDVVLKDLVVHGSDLEGVLVEDAQNLHVSGGVYYDNGVHGGEANARGISFQHNVSGVVVEDAEFYQSLTGSQSIGMGFSNTKKTYGVTLRNLLVHDHPQWGIFFMPGNDVIDATMFNITVTGCRFRRNGKVLPNNKNYHRPNLLIQKASNVLVEKNHFSDSYGWGIDCFVCKNAHIINNVFVNIQKNTGDGIGPGIGVEVNAGQNNHVLHNTFVLDTNGLELSFGNPTLGEPWPPPRGILYLYNNIFYKCWRDIWYNEQNPCVDQCHTRRFSNNLFDGPGVDPDFIDYATRDFRLHSWSPAVDKGLDENVKEDYRGISRPQGSAPDIGAFEYVSP